MSVLAVVFAILQEDGWSSATQISRLLVIFVSFGYAMLPITYILSMFFTIPASGFTRMIMFYVFTGNKNAVRIQNGYPFNGFLLQE